uniref:Uncharacterized protein n=1 Tax=Nelumbo nucifera TaxID=4432 RepID=A0A822XXM6_NELNU|nr:TPA_asm: hypothetical protein HUJ06_026236 [Nelumbo nucifera]
MDAFSLCEYNNKGNIPLFSANLISSIHAVKKRRIRRPLEDITHLIYPSARCSSVADGDVLLQPSLIWMGKPRKRKTSYGLDSMRAVRWRSLRKDFR